MYATPLPDPAPESSNGCPAFLPPPATREVWRPSTRTLRVPRRSSHPAAVECAIVRRDTSEPLPFWLVSTVSVQAVPGLTPSSGRRGRKSRKFPRSWTTDGAAALSDARAVTDSPRDATRPANTSLRTLLTLSTIGGGVPESATIESTRNVAG